jgi:hypothetical protein
LGEVTLEYDGQCWWRIGRAWKTDSIDNTWVSIEVADMIKNGGIERLTKVRKRWISEEPGAITLVTALGVLAICAGLFANYFFAWTLLPFLLVLAGSVCVVYFVVACTVGGTDYVRVTMRCGVYDVKANDFESVLKIIVR